MTISADERGAAAAPPLVRAADLVADEPLFLRQAGFNVSVLLSPGVAALVQPTEEEADQGQDLKGRLWDVLGMARLHRPRPIPDEGCTWEFLCMFWLVGRAGYHSSLRHPLQRPLTLTATLGLDSDGEPTATIGLPGEG